MIRPTSQAGGRLTKAPAQATEVRLHDALIMHVSVPHGWAIKVGWRACWTAADGKRCTKGGFATKTAAEEFLRDSGLDGRALDGGFSARWIAANGSRPTRTGFRTKSEAEAFARSASEDVEQARNTDAAPPKARVDRPETVTQLLDGFLDRFQETPNRKGRKPDPATVDKLQSNCATLTAVRTLAPTGSPQGPRPSTFGPLDPATLTEDEIIDWAMMLPEGTRHDIFRAFKQALIWAKRRGYLDGVPMGDEVCFPPRTQEERRDLFPFESWAEIDRIVGELLPRYRAVPVFAVGTGMRPSEWAGLHHSDIDRERRLIRVQRRKVTDRNETKPGCKTEAWRLVPYGERVERVLPDPPQVAASTGATSCSPASRVATSTWRTSAATPGQGLRKAGVEHRRLYDMRHTYVSWQLAQNVPHMKLTKMLGTSVAMFEKTYSRWLETDVRWGAAIDTFGEAVGQ